MCTHLDKTGSTYYFRRPVPRDLIGQFTTATGKPRTEWKFSLGTKDREEARPELRRWGSCVARRNRPSRSFMSIPPGRRRSLTHLPQGEGKIEKSRSNPMQAKRLSKAALPGQYTQGLGVTVSGRERPQALRNAR